MILLQMLTVNQASSVLVMSCADSGALATPATATLAADVPDNSGQYCRRIGELNGQPFRIDTVQHALDAVAGISATASSSNALHLPISGSPGGIRSTERWHTAPTQSPLTTLEFYHRIAGGILHHAQK